MIDILYLFERGTETGVCFRTERGHIYERACWYDNDRQAYMFRFNRKVRVAAYIRKLHADV